MDNNNINFYYRVEGNTSSIFSGENIAASFTSVPVGPDLKVHTATIAAKGDSFVKALFNSSFAEEAIDLLFKAVENRTKERDYFRLYCDMLDNTITEDEFDRIINEHLDEYVVKEDSEPDLKRLNVAIVLSKKIRNINSVEDLASLFSFNINKIKSLTHIKKDD